MRRAFHSSPRRENARPVTEYAQVKATLANRTDLAILVSHPDLVQAVWVPKKALDIGGKLQADNAPLKSEIEIGVELKLALEKGLI